MSVPAPSSDADTTAGDARRRAAGVVMVLLGGTCLSTAGILIRNIEAAGGWQILFYRGLFFFLTMVLFMVVRHRGRYFAAVRATGWPGVVVALMLGIASVFYVFGILSTTVANVVFIISASPLITAVLGRVVLGERPALSTWLAMFAALVGVALMVSDGLAGGGLFGVLCALGVAACFAGLVTTLRLSRSADMLPALSFGGAIAAVIAAVMAPHLVISPRDMFISFLLGTVQFGGGFILITLGARYVAAAETALLSLTETVLAPLWVWLAVDETPSALTLAGGAVVIGSVAGRAAASVKRRPAETRP